MPCISPAVYAPLRSTSLRSARLEAAIAQATARDHLQVVQMLETGNVAALEQAHRQHFHEISKRLEAVDETGSLGLPGRAASPVPLNP